MNLLPLLGLFVLLLVVGAVSTAVRWRLRRSVEHAQPSSRRSRLGSRRAPPLSACESSGTTSAGVPPSQRGAHAHQWLDEVHARLPDISERTDAMLARIAVGVDASHARAELRALAQLLLEVGQVEQRLIDVALLLDAEPQQRMAVDWERLDRLLSGPSDRTELSVGVDELRGVLVRTRRCLGALGEAGTGLRRLLGG